MLILLLLGIQGHSEASVQQPYRALFINFSLKVSVLILAMYVLKTVVWSPSLMCCAFSNVLCISSGGLVFQLLGKAWFSCSTSNPCHSQTKMPRTKLRLCKSSRKARRALRTRLQTIHPQKPHVTWDGTFLLEAQACELAADRGPCGHLRRHQQHQLAPPPDSGAMRARTFAGNYYYIYDQKFNEFSNSIISITID